MKDLIQKLTGIQETAEKRKMLTEDGATPLTDDKPQSLKDVFESIAGMKPIPVVGKEGSTQSTGAGFVNVTDPSLQNLGKTIGDLAAQKKLQIVVPTAAQTSGTVKPVGTQTSGTNKPTGATGTTAGGQGQAMGAGQAMQEAELDEKWDSETKVSPSEKGKYEGKTKAELTKAYNKLKASGPHKKGSPEYGKMRELSFAIRAKSGWGKVQEEMDEDIAKPIKKAAKSFKRGMQGWGPSNVASVKRDTDTLSPDSQEWVKQRKVSPHSPAELQQKLVNRMSKKKVDEVNNPLLRKAGSSKTLRKVVPGLGKHEAGERAKDEKFNANLLKSSKPTYYDGSPNPYHETDKAEGERSARAAKRYSKIATKESKLDEKFASQQQAKLMYAAAGDKDVSKKTGVSQKVAKEFIKKSHGQKVSKLPKKVSEAHTADQAEKKFNKYNDEELNYMLDRAYGRSKPGDAHKQKRAGQAKDAAYNVMWRKKYKDVDFDLDEADIPSTQGIDTKGAGLGAGRSMTTLEGKEPQVEVIDNAFNRENYKDLIGKKYPKSKAPAYARVKEVTEGKKAKPDFLDMDKDGNKEEPMKKAIKDKKKAVKESISSRISAARAEGRSHGLRGHSHCGKNYDDMDEARAYHDGYKEGLDECYGMGVYESTPMPLESDMDEGNAFTGALARTPKGGKFSLGGKTFTDRSGYDSPLDEYAFESWDKQLNSLLNEGISVSISKGLEGGHDSATVTATEGDSDKLMSLIKQAGLGVFGDEQSQMNNPAEQDGVVHGGIEVVGDHDGMMGIMKKLANVHASGSEDYADEEDSDCGCQDEEMNEARCDECGMMESKCGCEKEQVDEVETEDQMTAQVAEDESGQEEMGQTEADEDKALATADAAEDEEEEVTENFSFESLTRKLAMLSEDSDDDDDEEDVTEAKDEDEEEEDVTEDLNEWANAIGGKGKDAEGKGTDASFEQDIEFMTKVIAGGLNKPKSTGQTTIPVIAGQANRTEQPSDWATLAGIK